HGNVAVPEIRLRIRAGMRVVVDGAAAEAEEMVVAALQRSELREVAEMPFADERRAVADLSQQRGQRRMFRWKTDVGNAGAKRLLEADTQPVLIAAGDQADARCRADRGIRVGLQESHAIRSKPIDVRCTH